MTCRYRNARSDDLLACMRLTPLYGEQDVMQYLFRGSNNMGDAEIFALACLRVNRQIRPDIPEGPCGSFGVSPPTGAQTGFRVIGGLAASDPEPISKAVLSWAAQWGGFFSKLFSGAPSQKELATDCQVVIGYNQFADQMEAAVSSGQVPLQDALLALKQVHDSVDKALSSLDGYNIPSWAPYFHRVANESLFAFNKNAIYPHLADTAGAPTGKVALYGAGALVAAKFLGVL